MIASWSIHFGVMIKFPLSNRALLARIFWNWRLQLLWRYVRHWNAIARHYWRRGWGWINYGLSGFMPRNKNLWLFTTGSHFFDNAGFLFLYVNKHVPNIRAIWFAKTKHECQRLCDMGYHAVLKGSFWAWWYAMRGKFYFVTHNSGGIGFFCSRKAVIVNLWHGAGIKKFRYNITVSPRANYYRPTWWQRVWKCNPGLFEKPAYVLSTSRSISANIVASAFDVDISHCLNYGNPRNAAIFADTDKWDDYVQHFTDPSWLAWMRGLSQYKAVILYVPTFREYKQVPVGFDVARVNALCRERNVLFVAKPHPTSFRKSWDDAVWRSTTLSHVAIVGNAVDTDCLLARADLLVTDYSTVMLDYMLTGRPILLYAPDLDDYMKTERGLHMEYEDIGISNIAYSQEIFMRKLEMFLNGKLPVGYDVAVVRRYHDHVDGEAGKRIIDHMLRCEVR